MLLHTRNYDVWDMWLSPELEPTQLAVDRRLSLHLQQLLFRLRQSVASPSATWEKALRCGSSRNAPFRRRVGRTGKTWMDFVSPRDRKRANGVCGSPVQTHPVWPPPTHRRLGNPTHSYPDGSSWVGLNPCRNRSHTPWCGRALSWGYHATLNYLMALKSWFRKELYKSL